MTPKNLDFEGLQKLLAPWVKKNFGDRPSYQPLLGAVEEIGELSHAHLKAEQGIRGTPEELEAKAKDAVADTIIFLADYANARGWDLQKVVEDTLREVLQREWRKDETPDAGPFAHETQKRP